MIVLYCLGEPTDIFFPPNSVLLDPEQKNNKKRQKKDEKRRTEPMNHCDNIGMFLLI